jgi:hypothetical protein
VFPGYLVFGKPVWSGSSLQFVDDAYLTIEEKHFEAWLKSFPKFAFVIVEKPKNNYFGKKTIICSDECSQLLGDAHIPEALSNKEDSAQIVKNLVYFEIIEDCNKLMIKITKSSVCLILSEEETIHLIEAFNKTFFKSFCYSLEDTYQILDIIRRSDTILLTENNEQNSDNYKHLITSLQHFTELSRHQICFYAEVIMRHQNLLIHYKSLPHN